jgi:tRNA (mo5U34)-methyltransferase
VPGGAKELYRLSKEGPTVTRTHAEIMEKINSVKYWYHPVRINADIVAPGSNDAGETLRLLGLPESCAGLRALDLGTRDGFFAFELERRGAEVVAVDYLPADQTGFKVAAELLGSRVTFFQDNVYNITKEKYGTFDIVLFLGLIYHLPDPMLALAVIRSLCGGELYLETQVIDNAFMMPDGSSVPLRSVSEKLEGASIMQFYPGTSLNADPTNYWAPNMRCMEMMLVENNFAVLAKKLNGARGIFKCKVSDNADLEFLNNIARGKEHPTES